MNNEQIKYSLANRELKLSNWEKVSHYKAVGIFFIIPIIQLSFLTKNYFENSSKPIDPGYIWSIILFPLIGILFYFFKKKQLTFKEVNTSLNRTELNKIIKKVAKDLEWTLDLSNSKIIVAKTRPIFFGASPGEQITILFDNRKVLVNSICDPTKNGSSTSMGRNKQNEGTLIRAIKRANKASIGQHELD